MKKTKYTIQVSLEHYDFNKYVHLDRWISFYYQVKEVVDLAERLSKKKLNILEIGVGNKITASVLKGLGHKVKTLDIDPVLKPDFVGSLPGLEVVKGKHFDCVLCFEVLEHIKAEDVGQSLKNISKITDNAIISVPNKGITFSMGVKLWFFHSRSIFISFPTTFLKHKFNGEHHWELEDSIRSWNWLKNIIGKTEFTIFNNYRLPLNPYHRFIVLTK